MTQTFPDWAYLSDESGRHWYHLSKGTKLPRDGDGKERPPQKALFAIPSRDLISHPHWVSSKDDAIIAQVVAVETEKLGMRLTPGPGRISDWKPVKYNGTRTLVQSVAIPWDFETGETKATEFIDFIPQYSLYPPPADTVALWKEDGEWIAGYANGNRWAHIQALGELSAGEIASEIKLTLIELSAKEIIDETREVVVWGGYDVALHQSLQEQTGFEVRFEPKPLATTTASEGWNFEPHEVSRARIHQSRKKRGAWIGVAVLFAVFLIAAAAVFHLWTLQKTNENLRRRIADNRPAAEVIEKAMTHWDTLSPAIEPRRSPLELFHQISRLLPPKGFRVTSYEVQDHRIISLTGEASNMGTALKFKGDLEENSALSDYEWEERQPRQKGDLIEFNAIGKYRFAE
ncbi:MAG: hypothetical protein P1U68_05330 [Verrucomicrobiales bacterium]|nr:hypothetical protein [Verrucomicrobiales bacterium]